MRSYNEQMLKATEEFIVNYQKTNGKAPSLRVIGKAFQSFYGNSIDKVQRYVKELSIRGLINYNEGIQVMSQFLSGKTNIIPIVGDCPCGNPIMAVENIEGSYALPVELFGNTPHFILRAVGYSMINAGIDDGDLMIVRQQNDANAGDIVIALIDDTATAKVYLPQKDGVILRACNDSVDFEGNKVYKDIVVKRCQILGKVDKVIHTPRVR